jgi:hypothetical protein
MKYKTGLEFQQRTYGVIKKDCFCNTDRILNRITGVTSGCWWLVLLMLFQIFVK